MVLAWGSSALAQYDVIAPLGSVNDMWGHTYEVTVQYTPSVNGPSTEYQYKVEYNGQTKFIHSGTEFNAFFPQLLSARQQYTSDKNASLQAAEVAYEYITGNQFSTSNNQSTEFSKMEALLSNNELISSANEVIDSETESEVRAAQEKIVNYFMQLQNEGVISGLVVSWEYDNLSYYFNSEFGNIPCLYNFSRPETDSFSSDTVATQKNVQANINYSAQQMSTSDMTHEEFVGNQKVLILSSFDNTSSEFTDAYIGLQNKFKNAKTGDFHGIMKFDATVEDYKDLSNYGIIVINSHGDLYNGTPVIKLGRVVTYQDYETNEDDHKAHRLVLCGILKSPYYCYGITPSFIECYNKSLPKSLVYSCTCFGFANEEMVKVFTSIGAKAYTGYSDSVDAEWDSKILNTYFDSLLNGDNVADAWSKATWINGYHEYDDNPAYFLKYGDELKIVTHRYKVFDIGMTWSAANSYCQSLGGHLATITSVDEEKTVTDLIKSGSKNFYWLGGKKVNGIWTWITGENWNYTNWCPYEPNSAWSGEDSLTMYRVQNQTGIHNGGLGQWNDLNNEGTTVEYEAYFFNTNLSGFVCEWD